MATVNPDLIPFDWPTIMAAIHEWFSETTGLTTIWANQDGPQPDYPYAVLNIINGPQQLGIDETRIEFDSGQPAGEEIKQTYCGPRTFTVSCQVNTNANNKPDCNARHLVSIAEAGLNLLGTESLFSTANISTVRTNVIDDFSLVINGEFVSRAQLDVEMLTVSQICERTGYINNVDMTGTLTDEGGNDIVEDFSTSNP